MKKEIGSHAYLFPMPVLIISTYNDDGSHDAMNAAWGSICDHNKVALYLGEDHRTFKNIEKRKAFCVAFGVEGYVAQCDFVGVVSANDDANKMAKSGFSVIASPSVDAPIINELPVCLECTLESIDYESGCVVGNIVNVVADDSVLTDGKIDMNKFKPIAYNSADHGYYALGSKVGNAFHDGLALK